MAGYADRPGERPSYRVSDDPREAAQEGGRLAMLGALRDRRSAAGFETIGIGEGWRCLDVGSGGGTLARWLAQRVGPTGAVLSTDVDVRFQPPSEGNLEVRQHDVVHDPLPEAAFDLVHARGLLQTLDQRETVLDKLVHAAKPGGWVVIQDPDWGGFPDQPLPDAFRRLWEAMTAIAVAHNGYDPHWGRRIPSALRARGLEAVDAEGRVYAMHGGTDSAEYLMLGYERAAPGLVRAGLVAQELVDAGLAAARRPDFLATGPVSMIGRGRRPSPAG